MNSIYSVGQVNTYIKNMFDQDFMLKRIYIKGEVSNCKYHTSGHIYFSLKDETGSISCPALSCNVSNPYFFSIRYYQSNQSNNCWMIFPRGPLSIRKPSCPNLEFISTYIAPSICVAMYFCSCTGKRQSVSIPTTTVSAFILPRAASTPPLPLPTLWLSRE